VRGIARCAQLRRTITNVDYLTRGIPSSISELQRLVADLSPGAQTVNQVAIQDTARAAMAASNAAVSAANTANSNSKAKADSIYATATTTEHAHCPNGHTRTRRSALAGQRGTVGFSV
jgi:hypothetical protein